MNDKEVAEYAKLFGLSLDETKLLLAKNKKENGQLPETLAIEDSGDDYYLVQFIKSVSTLKGNNN